MDLYAHVVAKITPLRGLISTVKSLLANYQIIYRNTLLILVVYKIVSIGGFGTSCELYKELFVEIRNRRRL